MRLIVLLILAILVPSSVYADNNQAIKNCLVANNYSSENFDSFDWNRAAACASNVRQAAREAELAELRDFLKHNPRYRVPGQSLNRCWGKPREMPFESSYIRVGPNGMEAGVNYKDTLPAGCYENAPWDNRNAKN